MREKKAFLGWSEAAPSFPPTYRYHRNIYPRKYSDEVQLHQVLEIYAAGHWV
jgi:hypothetical protein